MFSPNEGRLVEPIESAQMHGTLKIDLPFLREDQPRNSPEAGRVFGVAHGQPASQKPAGVLSRSL